MVVVVLTVCAGLFWQLVARPADVYSLALGQP
jgi:hypothetical protein